MYLNKLVVACRTRDGSTSSASAIRGGALDGLRSGAERRLIFV
jgi:hypothetical protein